MDVAAFWLIVVAAASPIAGVVAFAVQLRQVKKLRKENEKLELEITQLKRLAEEADSRIQVATFDEVKRHGYEHEVMFSRAKDSGGVADFELPYREHASVWLKIKSLVAQALVVGLALLFVAYLIFDIYRAVRWCTQAWFS